MVFDTDEHPRATTLDALAKMKPAFKKDGTVTAGNASGINDGAAFPGAGRCRCGCQERAEAAGAARFLCGFGDEASLMGDGPIPSTRLALKRAGLSLDQIDVIEANEAFAAQAIAVGKGLNLDAVKTNPNGGANCARPSGQGDRRGDRHQAAARDAAYSGALRPRHHVHRRRSGYYDHLGTLLILPGLP